MSKTLPSEGWRSGQPAGAADSAELVRSAQRGDTRALADLLDVLAPYVGRLCGPIALDEGPDAAQEALIVIFRNLDRLSDPTALYGWVRTITIREAVRVASRAARVKAAEPGDVPQREDPQLAVHIRDVLDRLSPQHRAVLVLRDLEGLDEATVSELLAVSTGTVKSRLHRARHSFKKAWAR